MSDMPRELAKYGLKRLTDNREGKAVQLPKGALGYFLGDAIRAEFARPIPVPTDAGPAAGTGGV